MSYKIVNHCFRYLLLLLLRCFTIDARPERSRRISSARILRLRSGRVWWYKFLILQKFFCFFLIFLFFGCARKQKNIFDFSQQEKIKVNRLSLPVVCGLHVEKHDEGVFLSWQKIKELNDRQFLIGYNVYKFLDSGFIPKSPLNKNPLISNNFLDCEILNSKKLNISFSHCYLIRATFEINGKKFEGPTSQIKCIK